MSLLRAKRKEAHLLATQVATLSGINWYKLLRLERQEQELLLDDAIKLAPILHCNVEDLLPQLRPLFHHEKARDLDAAS